MGRKAHRQVHERLTEWADSAPPLPSPALARFMGPVRPRPALGGNRAVRAAVRTGLGIKVFGLLAAMAVTGAAAVGVSQVAHEPEPATPVVVPVAPSDGPDPTTTGAPDDDPSTSASPSPSTTPPPRTTSSTPTAPRVHRTRSASPTPRPHPSGHESEEPDPAPADGPDQPDPISDVAAGDTVPAD